ncbi:hypothetical protein TD95_004914 [Thielaviopsis punctulata]|uniref:Pseudouridine synthase RsuA/RluA-like domain-containing protein n=1 Tax=Thielaviopsis punctulata TaxID=72032 RepID=A0A0F4ZIT3_9PEZI|nr:hypothetical protein TD95_004914 [Thielaviopsis punctulata]
MPAAQTSVAPVAESIISESMASASRDDPKPVASNGSTNIEAKVIDTGNERIIVKAPRGKQKGHKHVQNQIAKNPNVTATNDIWPRPYYFEDGLRRVKPYFFTYNTYCKQRWRKRELLDIFTSEFRDRPPAYYKSAIEKGMVQVNGNPVTPQYLVQNGDLISHTIHRHEPPVTSEPIRVLHEDDSMMVVVKPAGVPVHPAGRYMYNSVVEILKSDRNDPDFHPRPCHRLDRLTSGIMFFAKTQKAAEELSVQISARTVRKEYIARVIGRFPDGEVVCDQPILQISPKLGLNRVRANGKTARTVFKRLAYYGPETDLDNGPLKEPVAGDAGIDTNVDSLPWMRKQGYSIVRCLPVTGRTHQIRVHLQFQGHPIENDPIYANQKVWGADLGSGDIDGSKQSDADVMTRLQRMGREDAADAVAYHDEMLENYEKRRAEKLSGETCDQCGTELFTDPGDQELSVWLHSLRYADAGGAWGYTTPLPKWALPPDGIEGPTEVGGLEELVKPLEGLPSIE